MTKSELGEQISILEKTGKVGPVAALFGCNIQDHLVRLFNVNDKDAFVSAHQSLLEAISNDRHAELERLIRSLAHFQKLAKRYFERNYEELVPPLKDPIHEIAWFFLNVDREFSQIHTLLLRAFDSMASSDRLGNRFILLSPNLVDRYQISSTLEGKWVMEDCNAKEISQHSRDEFLLMKAIRAASESDETSKDTLAFNREIFLGARKAAVLAELETLCTSREYDGLFDRVYQTQSPLKVKWLVIKPRLIKTDTRESFVTIDPRGFTSKKIRSSRTQKTTRKSNG